MHGTARARFDFRLPTTAHFPLCDIITVCVICSFFGPCLLFLILAGRKKNQQQTERQADSGSGTDPLRMRQRAGMFRPAIVPSPAHR